jgi:tripeptidyl-peptidase-1
VHSISYGQPEAQTLASGIRAFDTEAMKLGVQGVSILVSTGDDGVAGPAARSSSGLCGYNPQWPATSPYVTSVGATQGPEQGKPEVVCETPHNNNTFITSGGGFSATVPMPNWQATQVAAFLSNTSATFGPGFNNKGRGYPDVALIGHLYPILVGGEVNIKDGTSASTPVMAGILSLVNDARLSAGKPAVGFANPALYEWAGNADIFHDITEGANNCCSGGWSGSIVTCCPSHGFHATKGWDPTTGLGSVNVGNLISAWMAL